MNITREDAAGGPVVLSFGGGVDSTAMFVLVMTDPRFADLKARLVEVVWSDVSGGRADAEWPGTWEFVTGVFKPFVEKFGVKFTTVYADKKLNGSDKRTASILEYYESGNIIPPATMGGCSITFKVEPITKHLKATYPGQQVTVLIGYEANETHRYEGKAKNHSPNFTNRFPLVEAGLNRTDCEKLIEASPLKTSPIKSACWFCTKACRNDWRKLAVQHPEKATRAVAWEQKVQAARRARGNDKPFLFMDRTKTLDKVIALKPFDPAPEVFEDTHKDVPLQAMLDAAAGAR